MVTYSSEQRVELGAEMTKVVTTVRSRISDLRNRITNERALDKLMRFAGPLGWVSTFFTSTEDARNGALSALNTLQNGVNRLDSTSRMDVLEGRTEPRKWLAAMEELTRGVAAQARDLGDATTAAVLTAQYRDTERRFNEVLAKVTSTIEAIVDAAPAAAKKASDTIIAVSIGGGLLALAYILSPAISALRSGSKALSGTGSKRKKRRR